MKIKILSTLILIITMISMLWNTSCKTVAENETPAISSEPEPEVESESSPPLEYIQEPVIQLQIEPEKQFYNVPLDEDLQLHIIHLCEEYHISPAIVMAMIYRESNFQSDVIGDNGNSFGLMQIQPRWHYERMEKLGCLDLLDPYQNVTVGIDYLAEQIKRYDGDITKAIVAYNRGHYSGTVTNYAKDVLAYAEKIQITEGDHQEWQ